MIEIIPNWHPIFVNFTVALVTTAVGFYWLSFIAKYIQIFPKGWDQQFEIVGRWCLWTSAVVTIATVAAGFNAYYTISGHEEISHRAMIDHRNWALFTTTVLFVIAIWSIFHYRNRKMFSIAFLISLLVLEGLLLSTGWRGGELVFRHGLGFMSLPKDEGPGHQHQHREKDILNSDHEHKN